MHFNWIGLILDIISAFISAFIFYDMGKSDVSKNKDAEIAELKARIKSLEAANNGK